MLIIYQFNKYDLSNNKSFLYKNLTVVKYMTRDEIGNPPWTLPFCPIQGSYFWPQGNFK